MFRFSPFSITTRISCWGGKVQIVSKIKSYSYTLSLQRLPPLTLGVSLQFFKKIFFYWRVIVLPYCAGFCHTSTWISHIFPLSVEPPSHLPAHPTPLGCHRALGWAPGVTRRVPTGCLFYIWFCVCFCAALSFPCCAHKTVLCVCISIAVLQISSLVPSFWMPCTCVNIQYLFFSFWLTSLCTISPSTSLGLTQMLSLL